MAKGRYCYDYPRPAVTVDLAAFRLWEGRLQLLLIRRGSDPFSGKLALPGGFVEIDEPFEDAARREFLEETGLNHQGPVFFLGVYGAPGRDPRGRTISIVYVAYTQGGTEVSGGDDAAEALWVDLPTRETLAFDHEQIAADALEKLRAELDRGPAALAFLPRNPEPDEAATLFRAIRGSARGAAAWLSRVGPARPKDRPR